MFDTLVFFIFQVSFFIMISH